MAATSSKGAPRPWTASDKRRLVGRGSISMATSAKPASALLSPMWSRSVPAQPPAVQPATMVLPRSPLCKVCRTRPGWALAIPTAATLRELSACRNSEALCWCTSQASGSFSNRRVSTPLRALDCRSATALSMTTPASSVANSSRPSPSRELARNRLTVFFHAFMRLARFERLQPVEDLTLGHGHGRPSRLEASAQLHLRPGNQG